jgi:hypothetical protein
MQEGDLETAIEIDKVIKSLDTAEQSVISNPEPTSKYGNDIIGIWNIQHSTAATPMSCPLEKSPSGAGTSQHSRAKPRAVKSA